ALGRVFPPPARGPLVLTGPERARARLAADRHVTAIVQLVVRHAVGADVLPDLRGGPPRERVQLHERRRGTLVRVRLDDGEPVARGRALIAALPAHPSAIARERSPKRLDLADTAA